MRVFSALLAATLATCGFASDCVLSASPATQCGGHGDCVKPHSDVAENTDSGVCECSVGYSGAMCSEYNEQMAKLANETDGYRVVRRTVVHHGGYGGYGGYHPMYHAPLFLPPVIVPMAPAPVVITEPGSGMVVYSTSSYWSFGHIVMMTVFGIVIVAMIILCCFASSQPQTEVIEEVFYTTGPQQPLLAGCQPGTVTVIEEVVYDSSVPLQPNGLPYQQPPQYGYTQMPQQPVMQQQPMMQQPMMQQPMMQQPGMQQPIMQQPTMQQPMMQQPMMQQPMMQQPGLIPQTQPLSLTQQAPGVMQASAPPAYNPATGGMTARQ